MKGRKEGEVRKGRLTARKRRKGGKKEGAGRRGRFEEKRINNLL